MWSLPGHSRTHTWARHAAHAYEVNFFLHCEHLPLFNPTCSTLTTFWILPVLGVKEPLFHFLLLKFSKQSSTSSSLNSSVLIQNVCITYGYIKKMEENPHPRPTTPVVEGVVPRPLVGPVHPTHPLIICWH